MIRFIKKHWKAILFTLTGVAMVVLVADGVYVSTKPSRANALAQEAMEAFQLGDIPTAQQKIYKAALLAPESLAVVRAEAKVWSTLFPAETVELWRSALKLSGGQVSDRQGLAGALIAAGELDAAQEELDILLKESANDPMTKLVQVALLASNGRIPEALNRAISLTVRYPSRLEFWAAYAQLVAAQNNPETTGAFLKALEGLTEDRGGLGLWALMQTVTKVDNAKFPKFAARLLEHPMATRDTQLWVLLQAKSKMGFSVEVVRRQAQRFFNVAQISEQKAYAGFLLKAGDYEGVFEFVSPQKAVQDSEFLNLYLIALEGREKWQAVLEVLAIQDLPLPSYRRELFRATALGKLGQRQPSLEAWDRSLSDASGNYLALQNLLMQASSQRELSLVDEIYTQLIAAGPVSLRFMSYRSWVGACIENGRLDQLLKVLDAMAAEYPQNSLVEDSLIYYNALAGKSGNWVGRAYAAAQKNSSANAGRITLALALLKDNQPAKALEVINSARVPNWAAVDPSWQFVHAAILKANGLECPDLSALANSGLPQERALVR